MKYKQNEPQISTTWFNHGLWQLAASINSQFLFTHQFCMHCFLRGVKQQQHLTTTRWLEGAHNKDIGIQGFEFAVAELQFLEATVMHLFYKLSYCFCVQFQFFFLLKI